VFDLTFTVIDREGGSVPLTLPIDQAVIAGWTGRDPVARDKHIVELEALGIKRPATTPIYYRCSARRLTQEDSIEACGEDSSGEVEFILIGWQGRIFVGLASDHTDRKVESYSVTVSKQMCDKPIASTLWELEDVSVASASCIRRARWMRCCRSGNCSPRALRAASCPTAARCSAAPLPPRAVSARRIVSSVSWKTPC
jgi:hypothetical protein